MEDRHDPFDDMPAFNPRKSNRGKPDQEEVERAAQAAGFDDRALRPVKEKTIPLTIRLKESEVRRFKRQALQEHEDKENPYGAYADYFRKMWREHEEREGY
jgi:hypothetical protein